MILGFPKAKQGLCHTKHGGEGGIILWALLTVFLVCSVIGLLICKYKPFLQEVSVEFFILRWPLRPIASCFHMFSKIPFSSLNKYTLIWWVINHCSQYTPYLPSQQNHTVNIINSSWPTTSKHNIIFLTELHEPHERIECC